MSTSGLNQAHYRHFSYLFGSHATSTYLATYVCTLLSCLIIYTATLSSIMRVMCAQ